MSEIAQISALSAFLHRQFPTGPQGVIFDCDGVLVDSRQANIHYYNQLRRAVGLPPMSRKLEDYVHMSTGAQAVEAIIPQALRPLLRQTARDLSYLDEVMPRLQVMPGLIRLLDLLKQRGVYLAVNTNRMDSMDQLLNSCRLNGFFDPVVTVSKFAPKPDPQGNLHILDKWGLAGEQVLFIGDSSTDLNAAKAAGIPFLAFANPELCPIYCASFFDLYAALVHKNE